ncbi:nitrile hydratase subunit alpha [Rhizobium sp. Root1204]|uniref:nitrile hydratase subunit alpha n=1 Tax=Rhizobium sp. Root1204 TaxID=1736428 RepID=UPI000713DA83|nr:nitrile hydratase subunit alpha [Rhizobium sp. Root1204]KQV41299.1 nitrile hydratase subunit alpha [Rhizobium sp. Root1204]
MGSDHEHHDYHKPGRDDHHDHSHVPSEMALRVKALESILYEQKILDPAAVDAALEFLETEIGPHNGARVVARAWCDEEFRQWLLKDGGAAVGSMGFNGWQGGNVIVVENEDGLHNLVVCTLCSCYPVPLLGLPPAWYKSNSYRARSVREPRTVLSEFGLDLPETTRIRVWDSTADNRYLVVPQRPAGTEGWSQGQLAALVTRDSMIGAEILSAPSDEKRSQ